MKTYECSICYSVNHSSRIHCSCCGTIPAQYSIIRRPMRYIDGDNLSLAIPVVAAIGVDRTERHRTITRQLRTVAADYYAGE